MIFMVQQCFPCENNFPLGRKEELLLRLEVRLEAALKGKELKQQ